MANLFEALRGNEYETVRFLGTVTGTVPIEEFYASDNINSIIGDPAAKRATMGGAFHIKRNRTQTIGA